MTHVSPKVTYYTRHYIYRRGEKHPQFALQRKNIQVTHQKRPLFTKNIKNN